MQVALQATRVGRFKGAELALEWLVVAMVRLHMSIQAAMTQIIRETETKDGIRKKKKEKI